MSRLVRALYALITSALIVAEGAMLHHGFGVSRQPARAFLAFLLLGFLIAAGLGLAVTHLVTDRALSQFQQNALAREGEMLTRVLDRIMGREIAELRAFSRGREVEAALKGVPFPLERKHRIVLYGPSGVLLGRGRGLMRGSLKDMDTFARDVIADDHNGWGRGRIAPNGESVAYGVRVGPSSAPIGVLIALWPSPVSGVSMTGDLELIPADNMVEGVLVREGEYVFTGQLALRDLAIRYKQNVDVMGKERRLIVIALSLTAIVWLMMAFALIYGIGRRLILRPQEELQRSRARLRESEAEARRLAMVAENASDYVLVLDEDGVITWANCALLKASGYDLDDLLGQKPGQILNGSGTNPEALAVLRDGRVKGEPRQARLLNYRRDGESYLVDVSMTPVFGPDGALLNTIVVQRDVTLRAAAERRLREAVQAVDDAFSIIGPDERFVLCNDAYRKLAASLGGNVHPGKLYRDLLLELARSSSVETGGLSNDAWVEERMRLWREGGNREFFVRFSDGRTFLQRDVRTASGETVSIRTDVTELTNARQRAEEASAAKARFTASISHELRTPLIGVISMSELLLEDDLNESQRSGVELISQSGAALLTIINDILDFSKLEAGKLAMRAEPFDIVSIGEEVTALLTPTAAAKGIECLYRFDPTLPAGVIGDPGRIRQIITNLAGNAIKFTETGRVTVRLSGVPVPQGTRIRIEVEDSGPGIEPGSMQRIFGAYEQAGLPSESVDHGGTGLGLSICRQLADLMGAELSARSTLGEGSVFWFEGVFQIDPGMKRDAPLSGENVEILASEGFDLVLADKVRALGGTPVFPGEDVASEPVLCLLEQRTNLQAREGTPVILMTDIEGSSAENRVDRPDCRMLRRPVRTALLGVTIRALLFPESARKPDRKGVSKLTEAGEGEGEAGGEVGGKARILLVEDNDTTAMIVASVLAPAGYALKRLALAAPSVDESLEADLVLLDMYLPDMTGPEAVRLIRAREAREQGRRVPVLGFTASISDADHAACLAAGMDDIVTKPVTAAVLLEAIKAQLGARDDA